MGPAFVTLHFSWFVVFVQDSDRTEMRTSSPNVAIKIMSMRDIEASGYTR